MQSFMGSPHKRYNPLKDEWVLVSPHRLNRPWQGKVEDAVLDDRPQYDPKCYLCPGNTRANGQANPAYEGTYVFDNDFSALLPDSVPGQIDEEGLFVARAERGICRVVCFTPRHDLTLSGMSKAQIRAVVDTWASQYEDLAMRPEVGYVQIFENKGAIMGCSNPHPHGQIWATETLPVEVAKVDRALRNWEAKHGEGLIERYAAMERDKKERVVCDNGIWMAVVPFWAKWPYEVMIMPVSKVAHLARLDAEGRDALADILSRVTIRYDNLFRCPFPYTMGFHQAPTHGEDTSHWHLHGHFYPPLLRSATVQKFMVGFEMLATSQRDITPESAAASLRDLSEVHYARSAHSDGGGKT